MDVTSLSCLEKQQRIEQEFKGYRSSEEVYRALMEWGKRLPPYPSALKIDTCLVRGCQSLLYLHTTLQEGRLEFFAYTDALISGGLAALLLYVYTHETPQTLFTCPPQFLKNVGILEGLTPGRAQGVASLFTKMRHDVVQCVAAQGNYVPSANAKGT